jgi:hypothetical protein
MKNIGHNNIFADSLHIERYEVVWRALIYKRLILGRVPSIIVAVAKVVIVCLTIRPLQIYPVKGAVVYVHPGLCKVAA